MNDYFTEYDINIKVDTKSSAHDAFLEHPSSGTFKIERLESKNNLLVFGINKTKRLNMIAKNRLM